MRSKLSPARHWALERAAELDVDLMPLPPQPRSPPPGDRRVWRKFPQQLGLPQRPRLHAEPDRVPHRRGQVRPVHAREPHPQLPRPGRGRRRDHGRVDEGAKTTTMWSTACRSILPAFRSAMANCHQYIAEAAGADRRGSRAGAASGRCSTGAACATVGSRASRPEPPSRLRRPRDREKYRLPGWLRRELAGGRGGGPDVRNTEPADRTKPPHANRPAVSRLRPTCSSLPGLGPEPRLVSSLPRSIVRGVSASRLAAGSLT